MAAEWTVGLGSLVSYWTRKHRVDAREEMDIVHAISGRTRYMAPKIGDQAYPAPPPDPREVSPLLGGLWHWCALENCRSIIRAGRLFMREGLRGEMKLVLVFFLLSFFQGAELPFFSFLLQALLLRVDLRPPGSLQTQRVELRFAWPIARHQPAGHIRDVGAFRGAGSATGGLGRLEGRSEVPRRSRDG